MMVAVFALMSLALVTVIMERRRIAVAFLLLCMAMSAWLFLSDIHNRDYGFGLPWLNVEAGGPAGRHA